MVHCAGLGLTSVNFKPEEIDLAALQSIINRHDLGFDYIAAPTFPPEAELLTIEPFQSLYEIVAETI